VPPMSMPTKTTFSALLSDRINNKWQTLGDARDRCQERSRKVG
jgi:hypothetical protein